MTVASERHMAILLRVMASALLALACSFALVALAGCTTTQEIRRPDGSTEYLIACGSGQRKPIVVQLHRPGYSVLGNYRR